jgi:hypothetical protein
MRIQCPKAGVLLAIPSLVASGLPSVARFSVEKHVSDAKSGQVS